MVGQPDSRVAGEGDAVRIGGTIAHALLESDLKAKKDVVRRVKGEYAFGVRGAGWTGSGYSP